MNERKELTCSFETINAVRCQSTMDIMRSSYYCEKTELPLTLPAICPSCQRIFANNIQPIVAVNNGCTSNIDDCFDECSVVAVYRCSSCNELFTIWTDHKRDEEDNFSGTIIIRMMQYCKACYSYYRYRESRNNSATTPK